MTYEQEPGFLIVKGSIFADGFQGKMTDWFNLKTYICIWQMFYGVSCILLIKIGIELKIETGNKSVSSVSDAASQNADQQHLFFKK